MSDQNQEPTRAEFAQRLREESMAVRLSRSQMGATKRVREEQKDQMAGLFDAEGSRLSAGKKLLNKRHEKYLQVTNLLNRAKETWVARTLPYPEAGRRLIRRADVTNFNEQMRVIKAQLAAAVNELDAVYADLLEDARQKLGQLYNASDYPQTLKGVFDIDWSFESVDPPEYLRKISPKLYEAEQERVRARFSEAVALAEQSFLEEFGKMVSHLAERLTPSEDGKAKVFRDSAIDGLESFFDRFKQLNLGSNPDLDALVEQAKTTLKGRKADDLRKDVTVRDEIRGAMQQVAARLDAMQVDRPKRKIAVDISDEAA